MRLPAHAARLGLWCLLVPAGAFPQAGGATFGEVIRLGGTPSDVVLDESRGCLYLVNQNANRVDIYSFVEKKVVGAIPAGSLPVAAAMSMDQRFLYVSNNGSSSLSVIDLNTRQVLQMVSLSAKPEGVQVGGDGRVLITTQGTSSTDQVNSLLLFDSAQQQDHQVMPVAFAPPPPTPSPLPAVTPGRPITTFRGKLIRTPDGSLIVGLSTVNNNQSTVLFVYEAASASILRSRTVTGQSTVLSMAPDGSRFMAGFTLYDTATLNVIGQQSTSNVPFPLSSTSVSFSTLQNVGGSVFAPTGDTLYSAFNVAPYSQPSAPPQASTLLISNSRHLGARLGIKLPESILAKMVITSDGQHAWGLSESGLIHLPLGRLYEHPILQPETTTVFLAVDDCNRGLAKATLRINNLGAGKLTFSVPDTTAALVAQASTGVAPSTITFTMEPGRTNVTRQYGTNLYSGAASNSGAAVSVNLSSPEAINIPNTIQVYMNVRQPDQRGMIYPIETVPTASEGLQDILVDEQRDRVYIANAGYNRLEVFDRAKQRFIEPIEVGQLPHQMALAGDGKTLYVANTGGESISLVDLDRREVTGSVAFPAIPRSGNANPVTPQAVAWGLFGLQAVTSNGSQWKVVKGEATVRPTDSVTPTQFSTSTATGPVRMASTVGGRYIITLAGNGTVYLYDGLADTYVASNRPYTQSSILTYYGPLAAAPQGSYFLMNGFILNSSLAVIGGAESPTSTQVSLLASRRNVAAVAAIDESTFVRLTTPVKQNVSSTASGDARTTLELVDLATKSVALVGAVAENPAVSRFGNTRVNVPPRLMAVDSKGTVYALTLSGLSVIPLTPAGASRPQISAAGIINATDGSRNLQPGAFISVSGTNLAAPAVASEVAPLTVLGGVCVTFSDIQLPLLQTSATQIVAQVPDDLPPGPYVAQVRSLATGQRSDAVFVTVQKR